MADDEDFRFALVGEDKYSAAFRKARAEGARTGKAMDDASRSLGRYANQAKSNLEKVLGPARALAPEIDRAVEPLARVVKAGAALGRIFSPEQPARAARAFRDTAKAGAQLGSAFKGAASAGIASANDNLGAAATAAAEAGEGMAALGAEAGVAGGGLAALGVTAGAVATGFVAVGAAAVGAEIAIAKFISPFATQAQQLQNMADGIGLVTQRLQEFEGAGDRAGVSRSATAQSLAGLANVIHSAQYGLDANSIVATRLAGINPGARGARIDVTAAALQAADAIAAQKNPQAQARLAGLLGISPEALPLFRQGRAKLQAQMAATAATGDVMTDAQKQQLLAQREAQTNFNQRLDAQGKNAAAGLSPHSTGVLNGVAGAGGGSTPHSGFRGWLDRHVFWGQDTSPAGPPVASVEGVHGMRDYADDASAMLGGIVHQESRGRQAGADGGVLRSNRGAIGAAQMLPETAQRAAAWAGIRWDPHRFNDPTDKAYSLQLGQAELQRLLTEFGGNRVLAAAAYNAGEGRLTGGKGGAGWLKRIGDPRKGEIGDLDFAKAIPFAETRDYVLRTQFGLAGRGAAPASPPAQAVTGEILVKVEAPAGTKVIAKQAGPVRLKVARTSTFVGG